MFGFGSILEICSEIPNLFSAILLLSRSLIRFYIAVSRVTTVFCGLRVLALIAVFCGYSWVVTDFTVVIAVVRRFFRNFCVLAVTWENSRTKVNKVLWSR